MPYTRQTKLNVRRRKRDRNFVAIPFSASLALLTLADGASLSTDITSSTFGEDLFAISVDLSAYIQALTAGEGDPMTVFVAHSDYSEAEIVENLDVSFVNPDDKVGQEQSRRLVRKVGVMRPEGGAGTHTEMQMIGRFGSRIVRQGLKFSIGNGFSLGAGVRNRSGSNLTTGSILRVDGTLYGRWQR